MDWMTKYFPPVIDWSDLKKRQSPYPGRNDLPELLNEHWDRVAFTDKPGALIEAWTMAEWPLRMVDADFWRHMFDELTGGYGELFLQYFENERGDTRVELLSTEEHLEKTITLYRGCVKGHEYSMSWTSEKPTAEWFGKRFDHLFGHPLIVTAEIPREYVYARVSEARGEDEYIIDPAVFEAHGFTCTIEEL